jgi:cytochrome c oxidase assembly factor CtaG
VALVYLWGWSRLQPAFPRSRAVAFVGGLFSVWIAVASPLVVLDHQLLTVHMVKHLLLMAVGPPLILWGMPAQWYGRSPFHPVLCWLSATAAVIGWHLPAAFQLALRSEWWHGVELASFLVAGLLFWSPVVQSGRNRWSVPMYLFLATLPCDVLSAFLVFCGRVVYPSYLAAPHPLEDQECAGALMWVCVTLIYLIPAVVITMQILSPGVGHPHEADAQTQ